jgi:ketol-acid reductoisomerase
MMKNAAKIYFERDGDLKILDQTTIAIIGYGNQGRAQALNLRDSGLKIIIGNIDDSFRRKAESDKFETFGIGEAVKRADILFFLLPDEELPRIYKDKIAPNLKEGTTLCFASGYNIAFNLIDIPEEYDVIMIAPRMIGIGVRERYLNNEGFFSFVTVHQDSTKMAEKRMLGLAKALGTLKKGAIDVTMKQEAILDLFNEQAFGPAFGRVLLTAINTLIENGLPPEAVLTEMYMSEEMAYTYRKMAQIGLVRQTNFHSHTSQYGAMSRGIKFLKLGLKQKMQDVFDDISSGKFAKEWESPISKLKFKVIKYFAMKQSINKIENSVRKNLKLKEWDTFTAQEDMEEILKDPKIKSELKEFEDLFEY